MKPYDLKELGARLKAKGLIQAEEAAEGIYAELKLWLKESAALTQTPFDDMAMSFTGQIDAVVVPFIDKIDGQEG
jgi:hypothetical protein